MAEVPGLPFLAAEGAGDPTGGEEHRLRRG